MHITICIEFVCIKAFSVVINKNLTSGSKLKLLSLVDVNAQLIFKVNSCTFFRVISGTYVDI